MSKAWPTVRLGDVLRRVKAEMNVNDELAYARLTIRMNGKGIVLRDRVPGQEIGTKRQFLARKGQLVLSKIDARNGAFGILPDECDNSIITGNFWAFDADPSRLLPAYFDYLTKTPLFVDFCVRASEGTTNRRYLQESAFLAQEVPLPPLADQLRVVARIEELAGQIHEARGLRNAAVQEAGILHSTTLGAFLQRGSKSDVELGTVCHAIIDNLHSNPRYSDAGIPCVRSPDVGWGTLKLHAALRTDEDEYQRRTIRGEPQPDDIVLVREGGGTGKCARVLPGQRFSLGQRVMMLRPNRGVIDPAYFLYQLLSPLIQEDQIAPMTKGSAAPHLNIGALRQFRVRLPPVSEQRQIVAELDAMQAQIDALKDLQAETVAELDALLPAILDRAFKGELV
jgi:type I restriction enzyme, S subunit